MKINRKVTKETELTSGPGKLTQALIIDKKLNGKDLTKKGELYIADGKSEIKDFNFLSLFIKPKTISSFVISI